MYRSAIALVAVVLVGYGNARGADDPRALLKRALQVSGDGNGLANASGTYVRWRGTLDRKPAESLILEMQMQPDQRLRLKVEEATAGRRERAVVVLDGKKSWQKGDSTTVHGLSEEDVAQIGTIAFHERVADLRALLRDKRCVFTALGESKIEGKVVRGIKVSCKGKEDTFLYFDKATGLITRARYHVRFSDSKRIEKFDIIFLDYNPVDSGAAEKTVLDKVKLEATGPALIAFLRKQTPARDAQAKARKLVGKLGHEDFAVREQASKDVLLLEQAAIPALQEAVRSADPEVRRRAGVALRRIQQKFSDPTILAAIDLLALLRPAGAAGALLDYLPAAPETVAREVRAALYHLGAGGGRPDPVLLDALKAPNLARRAAAEAALGRDGGAYARLPHRRIFRPEVQRPRKVIVLISNETTRLELQVQEQRFYNRFDDSLFARPAPNKP